MGEIKFYFSANKTSTGTTMHDITIDHGFRAGRLSSRRLIKPRQSTSMIRLQRMIPVLLGLLTALVVTSPANCFAEPPQQHNFYNDQSRDAGEQHIEGDILGRKLSPAASRSNKATPSVKTKRQEKKGGGLILQTVLGLAFVLCLIWVIAAWAKKNLPNVGRTPPSEAVQLLGQRSLAQRQTIQLIRCGSRILILGSTAQGLTTLSEITDPVEVDYLAGLCRQEQSNSMTSAFSQLFQNYSKSSPTTESPTNPLRAMTDKLGFSRPTPNASGVEEDDRHPTRGSLSAEHSLKERLGQMGRSEESNPSALAVSEETHG